MGIYSHLEKPPKGNGPPDRCEGMVGPFWNKDYNTGEYTEVPARRCQMGTNPFMPEVNYCGTHMPVDLIDALRKRRDLWQALSIDLWHEIRKDVPLP